MVNRQILIRHGLQTDLADTTISVIYGSTIHLLPSPHRVDPTQLTGGQSRSVLYAALEQCKIARELIFTNSTATAPTLSPLNTIYIVTRELFIL